MSRRPYMLTLPAVLTLATAGPAGPPADAEDPQRFDTAGGHYLVVTPPGYKTGDRPPLILALHGTNTLAGDMIGVWQAVDLPVPCLIAAPQNASAGWHDAEVTLIEEVYGHLEQRFSFDPRRVLLTGHSAGGTMAMYMLYERRFPATAVATSANYLPPTVTGPQVRARAQVPVFYAVGREDINHARMRQALVLLRTSGASVTMPALEIGHVLQHGVVQQAADWFGRLCARRSRAWLDQVEPTFQAGQVARAVRMLEEITGQRPYHPPEIVARADTLYRTVTMPANAELHAVRALIAADRKVEAVERLARLEAGYAGCRWAQAATDLRRRLETDPDVARHLQFRREQQRAQEARDLLAEIEKLRAADRLEQARATCLLLARRYGDLPEGRRAAELLDEPNWIGDQ